MIHKELVSCNALSAGFPITVLVDVSLIVPVLPIILLIGKVELVSPYVPKLIPPNIMQTIILGLA